MPHNKSYGQRRRLSRRERQTRVELNLAQTIGQQRVMVEMFFMRGFFGRLKFLLFAR